MCCPIHSKVLLQSLPITERQRFRLVYTNEYLTYHRNEINPFFLLEIYSIFTSGHGSVVRVAPCYGRGARTPMLPGRCDWLPTAPVYGICLYECVTHVCMCVFNRCQPGWLKSRGQISCIPCT